jgi:hypothetical protein
MGRFLRLVNGVPRMYDEASSVSIYDETVTLGVGGLTTGQPMTLPSSKTYTGPELGVYFNGQRIEDVLDYTWYGSAPRTQVAFTFDLVEGDKIRFIIDRAP